MEIANITKGIGTLHTPTTWDRAAVDHDAQAGHFALTLRNDGVADTGEWFRQHSARIIATLHDVGAILFRGFGLASAAAFNDAVGHIVPGALNYQGGTSPRTQLAEGVYTSTEYPQQYEISLHNEMSYSAAAPDVVFFACATAPADRGQTPFADCRKVLQRLPQSLVDEFETRGLRYERNMFGRDSPYNAWSRTFETRDPDAVERYCRAADIDFTWLPNDHLRTREQRPAVIRHPVTGERVWFNQANLWHFSNSPLAASLMGKSVDGLPMNVFFGDGAALDVAALDIIRQAYAAEKRMFSWEEGDLLVLDNKLVAHGRMPFSGPRKIMVALRSLAAQRANAEGVPG